MPPFLTEKQIEALLVDETRDLVLPEGETQVMTGPKLMWNAFDFIIEDKTFTFEDVIDFTQSTMKTKGYSFDNAFKSVLSYIDNRLG